MELFAIAPNLTQALIPKEPPLRGTQDREIFSAKKAWSTCK